MSNFIVKVFEEKVRIFEEVEEVVVFFFGMVVISSILYMFLKFGDCVVLVKDIYGGINKIFIEFFFNIGVDVILCNMGNYEEIEVEVNKGCKVLYLELFINFIMKIIDIERIVKVGKFVGVVVIIDNMFVIFIN